MPADRLLPTPEGEAVVAMAREVAAAELAPFAARAERDQEFPREAFRALGRLGLLSMPYPEEQGGGGLAYEVYLQALEEISGAWASVGVGLSVRVMSCYPLSSRAPTPSASAGSPQCSLASCSGGYCLSESQAGSDAAALRTRAHRDGEGYRVAGAKAWVTHGGRADSYTLFARTSDDRSRGVSCFLDPGDAPGLSAQAPEAKMGLTGSTTASIDLDGDSVDAERRIRSRARRRSPSSSRPTPRCASRPTPSRCWEAPATPRTSPSSGSCAR